MLTAQSCESPTVLWFLALRQDAHVFFFLNAFCAGNVEYHFSLLPHKLRSGHPCLFCPSSPAPSCGPEGRNIMSVTQAAYRCERGG